MDTGDLIEYLLLKGELARARDPRLRASLQQCLDQARHTLADAAAAADRTARGHSLYRKTIASAAHRRPTTGRMLNTRN